MTCDIVGSQMSLHRHVPSESESLYVIWKIECDWSHKRALIGWGKSKYKFSSVQERPNRISRVGDQERALIAEASRSRASCTLSSWATISLSPTWDSFLCWTWMLIGDWELLTDKFVFETHLYRGHQRLRRVDIHCWILVNLFHLVSLLSGNNHEVKV